MITCEVLTPWVGDGTENNPYRAKLGDDYPYRVFIGAQNPQSTAQLAPNPNLVVFAVTTDAETFAAIEANPDYFVVWSEAGPDGKVVRFRDPQGSEITALFPIPEYSKLVASPNHEILEELDA